MTNVGLCTFKYTVLYLIQLNTCRNKDVHYTIYLTQMLQDVYAVLSVNINILKCFNLTSNHLNV